MSACARVAQRRDLTVPAPNDMFICMKGIRPYKDKDTLMWVDQVKNVYLHLNLEFDPTIDIETVTMTQEMFKHISDQHMAYLQTIGLLEHVMDNIQKQ